MSLFSAVRTVSPFRFAGVAMIAVVPILLASCGFQLRGMTSIPPDMARTYIQTDDRHSLFYRRLRDGLRNAGVAIVDSPLDASATFAIRADETGQRVLSVSARNVPTEFEVYYSVVYDVTTETGTLLARRTQTLTRDYTWDETQVLGKEREERVLRESIVDDLIRVVFIQLSAI